MEKSQHPTEADQKLLNKATGKVYVMRILVIFENLFPPSVYMTGASNFYSLQLALWRLGVEVHILTSVLSWRADDWRTWFGAERQRHGVLFHPIDVGLVDRFPLARFAFTKSYFLVKGLVLHRKHNYDVIHVYSGSPAIFALTAAYKRLSGTMTFHTLLGYNYWNLCRHLVGLRQIDRIICSNKHMRSLILAGGAREEQAVYLPLGFNQQPFASLSSPILARQQYGFPRDKQIVLFVGPLETRKGAFTLAKAIPRIVEQASDTLFVFATFGEGGIDPDHARHREEIIETIEQAAANTIILEGQQDIPSLMAACDVFVLPADSTYGTHALPLTLLEAMVSGKAIVASNIVGVDELITDGENGHLFERGNSTHLADRILALLRDPEQRRRFGRRARQMLGRSQDTDVVAARLAELYQEVVGACQHVPLAME